MNSKIGEYAAYGMIIAVLLLFGFMRQIDNAIAPTVARFNDWADEKTKDWPNPNNLEFKWCFEATSDSTSRVVGLGKCDAYATCKNNPNCKTSGEK